MNARWGGVCATMAAAIVLASCMDTQGLTDLPQTPVASPVSWVLISPATAQVAPGKNVALQVELQDNAGRDLSGQAVHWHSSDSTVAIVDTAGVVTARKLGTANIVAQAGNVSAYAVVSVSNAPPPQLFVSLTPATLKVTVHGTEQIFATVKDTSGKVVPSAQVTWSTSNASVATVAASGEVTGINPGSAVIKATSGTGSSTAAVTVVDSTQSSPTPAPPPTQPAGLPSLFDDYSTVSPHWRHIRTMMTDFYYQWTPTERTWAGAHYDFAMSGDGSAWLAANPSVTHLPYALEWCTEISGSSAGATVEVYADMQQWYAAHSQYKIETAFLHIPSEPADSAHRLVIFTWDTNKWVFNPADPGLRAYTVDRLTRVASGHGGVFLDSEASSAFLSAAAKSAEYASGTDSYKTAHTSLLAAIKQSLGSKVLMINTAQYTTDFDLANAEAAGAAHLELMNNPLNSDMSFRWQWIEKLLSHGVFVDFVSSLSTSDDQTLSSKVPQGNSQTTAQRMKLWELASYYMVVPSAPDKFALQLENMWNLPYSEIWTRAQEADIGHPTGSRTILSRGNDPLGQGYTIFTRDFDRALVVVRQQSGYGTQIYTDASAITVPLPAGETWIPLNADGTLGSPVTSIKLRNAEAAILIKKSRVQ